MLMRVTTRRGHQDGHPTWCMSAPATHANAPDRVHTRDRQRHVQAVLGSNTRREARQPASGQIANAKWLTARSSATRRGRQLLYLQQAEPAKYEAESATNETHKWGALDGP